MIKRKEVTIEIKVQGEWLDVTGSVYDEMNAEIDYIYPHGVELTEEDKEEIKQALIEKAIDEESFEGYLYNENV
jgi:hypothetical protein